MSLPDAAEFLLLRGFVFTHETVRDWEERFAPIFAQQLRAGRKGQVGSSWYVDETYIRVKSPLTVKPVLTDSMKWLQEMTW